MSLDLIKKYLMEDDIFLRYKSLRQTAERQLPYDTLCDELEMIQVSRQARTQAHNLQPRDLLTVSLDEVSHRGRLTEIMVKAKRARADIAPVVDGLWHHIAAEYSDELKVFKTKGDRDSVLSTVLNKGYVLLANLDSLIDQCQDVIKEIDQTSFALGRAKDLMEMLIRKEHLVNLDV